MKLYKRGTGFRAHLVHASVKHLMCCLEFDITTKLSPSSLKRSLVSLFQFVFNFTISRRSKLPTGEYIWDLSFLAEFLSKNVLFEQNVIVEYINYII